MRKDSFTTAAAGGGPGMNDHLLIRSMRKSEWPALDRTAWQKAQEVAGPFDEGGLAANWRLPTIRMTEQGYGSYLSWLAIKGALDPLAMPIQRAQPDLVKRFIEEFASGRAPLTVAGAVRGIAYVVRATAPPDGLPWLTALAHRMVNRAEPIKHKLPRLASIAELRGLGHSLMSDGAYSFEKRPRAGAITYRNGLMIALLATRPMRRRNLGDLRLGQTFFVEDVGYRIGFSGAQTKTGKSIDTSVPTYLMAEVTDYLERMRPTLLGKVADQGWLWVGGKGQPLGHNYITVLLTKLTMRGLERAISPQLFRDCVATDIAVLDPKHVGITKEVLGHASLSTSQRYYNQANAISATRRLSAVISKLMEDE